LIPGNHTYSTPDWDTWRKYVKDEIPFSPTYCRDAYTELVRLSKKFHKTKTSTYRSKKWWDDEISN